MGVYLLFAGAILTEVTATISLKFSQGFTKLGPSILVVIGYALSFTLLAQVLKAGIPVAVVYAIWSAAGVALVAIIGTLFLGESMNLTMVAGLLLVIGGVVLLEAGRTAH
ncbi:DMT family transporter [Prauserella flavalba]|uniref:Small multidrug resistance pump n=1 Tax=Prauserella flavalba TaxID=1477506 RepID=A0A318MGX3_9PSEU|nr:SMR family transporter [Prauserella flavalba]PXY38400.1 hypothetical protein BA062_01180 [Prauserella flavalba]